jgi:hypothetical protein
VAEDKGVSALVNFDRFELDEEEVDKVGADELAAIKDEVTLATGVVPESSSCSLRFE